ncbi:serine protease [Nocardioides sp. zg-1228]|uniref:S1 family peptidase n=1 Tax=Nocardioides sp. zg-1228 TaxID=2763008 RepID=UPI001643338E|nr:serine protease [Nocardioides sp. zg-1228]MBC2933652.1 trypsin-like peptidase domain-containing protein [Nocardioides sp. zg-1228]QSF56228.1 trypsin-like peptidase domain-containing protein [Nocardioides sp. zg-1228]
MLVVAARRPVRRAVVLVVTVLVAALAVTAVTALGALAAPVGASVAVDGGRFAGTARLPGCSGAVVRWPAALDADPAVVLTNGHCVRSPFLGAREVLVDERSRTPIELLDGRGEVALTTRAARLQYATMYRTDVALLTLRRTYADLAAAGVTPLSLAAAGPARGDRVRIPSGYWREQRGCRTAGTAYRLHEQRWDWWDSIRLPARGGGCAIRGGYSGSPIVARATGLVVGVANTAWVGGRRCVDSACEESRRGRVVVRRHMNYGQQTWWLLTCLDAGRTFDLDVPGCRLAKPRR